jgi:hypothetical protein
MYSRAGAVAQVLAQLPGLRLRYSPGMKAFETNGELTAYEDGFR